MTRIKKIYTTLLLMALPILANAQSLVAYHVVGKITYNTPSGSKDVVMNTKLTNETTVNIPYGGKLELLDEANQKRITLKKPGKGTIKALSAQEEHSVAELSSKYVAYVKKQLNNKGLTSKQRYTDFATVTRHIDSVKVNDTPAPKKKKNPFASQFDSFKQESQKKMDDFRAKCNQEYNDFVRKAWEEFGMEPPKVLPVVPKVKPAVYKDTTQTSRFLLFGRNKKNKEQTKIISMEQFTEPVEQPKPVQEIKPVEVSPLEKEFAMMPFMFYGNELEVHLDETKRINLGKISPNNVADILQRLATPEYDNLLRDCLKLRDDMKMCDWAYLQMLKEITDQFCGEGTNEAALLMGYLYYQSGYKVRFASDNNRIYLLIASNHSILGRPYYNIDGEPYYPLEKIDGSIFICRAAFPKEKGLSLYINNPQKFLPTETYERTITSERFKDFGFTVTTNRSLLDFFDGYPSSTINSDPTSRWVVYAETPLAEDIRDQIYPGLKEKLAGLSEEDAVSRILNLVQTGLEYKFDDEVWGMDRVFFAEESMHYPFCDCEDRSILFTRLVRDLLGLECILIYYPGHLASAVHFTKGPVGDYYDLNGKAFTVCDATYIAAEIGMEMPNVGDNGATLVPIK